MAIRPEIIEAIRDRASIVEIVSETVNLKRSGRNFSGLCPFHAEKTPSFYVREEEGSFHCFGCGKAGSVFDFVMETRGLTFAEAVRFLAHRLGIEIEEDRSASAKEKEFSETKRQLRTIIVACGEFFQKELQQTPAGKEALTYLQRRGVSDDAIQTFSLGYSHSAASQMLPAIRESVQKRLGRELDDDKLSQLLVLAGVFKRSNRGEQEGSKESAEPYFNAFRGRLIFPITRSDRSPIAFGGRLLANIKDRPKYINSSESPVYSKRRTLYGLGHALPEVRRERFAYLVEGYLDVLAMYDAGIKNVVATCGTAITMDHAQILGRFCNRLTVVFDGDEAGKKAAASCFPIFLNSGIDLQVAMLPEGEDPNSLLVAKGGEVLRETLHTHTRPLLDVYLQRLLVEAEPDAVERSVSVGRVAQRFVETIRSVKNPVERELMLRRAAEVLQVSSSSLEELIARQGTKVEPAPTYRTNAEPVGHGGSEHERRFGQRGGYRASGAPMRQNIDVAHEIAVCSDPLESYCRQLLVAVCTEPLLAEKFLSSIPSALAPLQSAEERTKRVLDVISNIAKNRPAGVRAILEGGFDREKLRALEDLLERSGFAEWKILEESLEQLRIGGSRPDKVLRDLEFATGGISLKSTLEKMRTGEGAADHPDERLKLAQAKLEARRALEELQKRRKDNFSGSGKA